jgi:hypothetical protein
MTPVDDCHGQLILIATQVEALRRWVITRELPAAAITYFNAVMLQLGRHASRFAAIVDDPQTYHPLPPGQRSIFY